MATMNIVEIINNKSKGLSLSKEEINYFVRGVVEGTIEDYQTSALLMAIKINGMEDQELIDYARALVESGDQLPLNNELVDKHSSGGVGDKTSLILLPVLGAMGVKVFKLSGRGLGFTGGTIDKLEAVEGFKTELSTDELNEMVEQIGISISGQTPNLTPADGKLYALRDVTGTVDSPELIAASIISKKIASGAKNILIDLKVGTGAFTKDVLEAEKLANLMKLIAKEFDRNLFVLFSSMDQPLGFMAGNMVEVVESIEFLKGTQAPDLYDLIRKISTELYSKSMNVSIGKAENRFKEVLEDGSALELQRKWFEKHGVTDFEKATKLKARHTLKIVADKDGYMNYEDTKAIGEVLVDLRAGRKVKTDKLDYYAGIIFKAKNGDKVVEGDTLLIITTTYVDPAQVERAIKETFSITDKPVKQELILGEVSW